MLAYKHIKHMLQACVILAISSIMLWCTPVAADAITTCPDGWTGMYPHCVQPADSPDISPRDIKLVSLGLAVLLGWFAVKQFRWRHHD